MKHLFSVFILITVFGSSLCGQCPPTNPTMTISGLYSADIIPIPGSIIYVTSTGTITGSIYLNNSTLYNCGTILSKKITMRQSIQNSQYILENNNLIKCDTISLDSLGHLHNNDTLVCGFFKMSYYTSVDNSHIMDIGNFLIEKESKLNSQSNIKVNYFEMKDNNSSFFNLYGAFSARKLFKVGIGTSISGVIFICVDSCFINNGDILNNSANTWTPSIRVMGYSVNTGAIYSIDFCDISTSNGGMPDMNTGTLANVTYCTSQQYYCDFGFTSVKEILFSPGKILVFPNPTSDYLTIQVDNNDFDDAEIKITNSIGKTVLNQPFSTKISVELTFPASIKYFSKGTASFSW